MAIIPVESFDARYSPTGKGKIRFKLVNEPDPRSIPALDPCQVSAIIAILSGPKPAYDTANDTFLSAVSHTHGLIANRYDFTKVPTVDIIESEVDEDDSKVEKANKGTKKKKS